MKTKQCGNCKFWDRENASIYGAIDKPRARCHAPIPDCIWDVDKMDMLVTDGEACDVYKGIKEKK